VLQQLSAFLQHVPRHLSASPPPLVVVDENKRPPLIDGLNSLLVWLLGGFGI